MFCTRCGATLSTDAHFCTSCGKPITVADSPQKPATNVTPPYPAKTPKKFNKNWLLLLLLIPAVIWFGISIYNNSGAYRITSNGHYSTIEYHGDLEKLVNSDFDIIEDFLDGNVDGDKRVAVINCNDYILEWHRFGSGGSVDIVDNHLTFYERGLRKYDTETTNGYYDRFRDDFVFTIRPHPDSENSHSYYFQSLSDVSRWLKKNF